jgi:poly(beta-D-mannuronate) lyase
MPLTLPRFSSPFCALGLVAVGATRAPAATLTVDTAPGLQSALSSCAAGDTLVVRNGHYDLPAGFALARGGLEGKPVTIAAESVGGVEFRGAGGLTIAKTAAYLVIRGFTFRGAAGTTVIAGGAHDVRFTRNTFACEGVGAYLTVTGDNVEVDHNEFRDKHTLGNMISVTGVGHQVARRLWIHHNYFHDFRNAGGNGAETIRFGLSTLSMSNGDGLVEHNLFARCTGENELISNKSCRNTYRYNTFLDSPGAQLTLRHGNECRVYANVFRGLDGLRVFGDRHLIHSNYFEGNSRGLNLGNGDGEVADGAKLTSHDRPDDCIIVFNTFVNNREAYEMDARKDGLGATRTVFAFNVIQGGNVAAKLAGPHREFSWHGNVLWDVEPGDLPAEGFSRLDPRLAADSEGIFRPIATSPLLAAGGEVYPEVDVDLDGQPRPARKSIGADERSSAPIVAPRLRPSDVGPSAE